MSSCEPINLINVLATSFNSSLISTSFNSLPMTRDAALSHEHSPHSELNDKLLRQRQFVTHPHRNDYSTAIELTSTALSMLPNVTFLKCDKIVSKFCSICRALAGCWSSMCDILQLLLPHNPLLGCFLALALACCPNTPQTRSVKLIQVGAAHAQHSASVSTEIADLPPSRVVIMEMELRSCPHNAQHFTRSRKCADYTISHRSRSIRATNSSGLSTQCRTVMG